MVTGDQKDACILMLAEKLYICSRLLTCAAERLKWDNERVQELVTSLKVAVNGDLRDANIKPA